VAEREREPVSVSRWRACYRPTIPARLVEAGIVHAASRRFRRERHHDRAVPVDVPRPGATGGVIAREIPLAVQRAPAVSLQLWPRIAVTHRGVETCRGQLYYVVFLR